MDNPLVSVVIVTWNRREDVLQAVQSIYDQAYQNFEIVVVDNGSTDGTVDALERLYPAAILVTLQQNVGAPAGRNAGIRVARGEFIFFLDSDASLATDTLINMVRKFQAMPEVGVIACKVVNAYTKELDPNGGWIFAEKDKSEQNSEFLSYSFCSAGSAIRKQVIDQVGLFWNALFIYREEDDLSLRVWNAGYKILYYPQALIYHRVSPHKRVVHHERQYFDLRNSLYIYFTRYPWWMLLCFTPLKIGTSFAKGFKRGCWRQVFRALFDVVQQFFHLWGQRQPISNRTAYHYIRLQREHGPLHWDLTSWLKYKL